MDNHGQQWTMLMRQAQRLRRLRKVMGMPTQTAMAAALGITVSRWNNFEHGSPLSNDVIVRICRRFPGVTSDWLLFGKTGGLPPELKEKLSGRPNDSRPAGSERR